MGKFIIFSCVHEFNINKSNYIFSYSVRYVAYIMGYIYLTLIYIIDLYMLCTPPI